MNPEIFSQYYVQQMMCRSCTPKRDFTDPSAILCSLTESLNFITD